MPNEQVAGLLISIDANTVKLRTEMDKAKASTRAASQQMKTDMMEARGGIKLVGEEIGVNLNRHLVSFLAKLPGVAPAMAAAFSGAAVVGIGMAIGESINRLVEWINKGREAATVLNEGFNSIRQAGKLANDEQRVTNDRLDDEIAKLTGKHPNTLKDELDEARVEADKLWKSLEADNKAADELIARGKVNGMVGLITFQAPTGDTEKLIHNQGQELTDLAEQYQTKMDAATTADERSKIQAESRLALLAKEKAQLAAIEGLYNSIRHEHETVGGETYGGTDPSAVLGALGGRGHQLEQMIRSQQQGFEGSDKGDQVKKLKQTKEEAEAARKAFGEFVAEMDKDSEFSTALREKGLAELARTGVEGLDQIAEHREMLEGAENRDAAYAAAQARAQAQARAEGYKLDRENATGAYQRTGETSALRVDLGQESPAARTREMLAALDRERAAHQESFQNELQLWEQGSVEYAKVLGERSKADQEYFKQQAELQKQATQEGFGAAFLDLEKKWTDWSSVFKETLNSGLSSVNGELVRMMTTQYRRGDWKAAAKPIFSGLAMSGLQGAEGSLMKAFAHGGGKLGTKGNPMYVTMAGGLPGVAGSVVSSATSNTGGFLGFLGGIAKFAGFMADGGVMSPGGFYLTGERGPELINVGSTSRIHSNSDTRRALGGGGDVHHHFNIDARGATDPAAVDRAVRRGIAEAAPHIAASGFLAGRDYDARRPNYRG